MLGEIQVRNFFVGLDYPGHANTAALQGGTNLDLAVLSANGVAAVAGQEFKIYQKNNKGTVSASDNIDPNKVTYARSVAPVARVGKSYLITVPDAVVGENYTIELIVPGFGSLSVEDEMVISNTYRAKTGDAVENVVDGLIRNFAFNVSRQQPEAEGTFTYTNQGGGTIELPLNNCLTFAKVGTTQIRVTENPNLIENYYVTGRKDRLDFDFKIGAYFPVLAPVVAVTPGTQGVGTGFQTRNMEYYYRGNRQDTFRQLGYPHNFEPVYDTNVNTSYHYIEIGYYDEGRDDPMKGKKHITLAIPDAADANAIIADINTALTGTAFQLATV